MQILCTHLGLIFIMCDLSLGGEAGRDIRRAPLVGERRRAMIRLD